MRDETENFKRFTIDILYVMLLGGDTLGKI